MKFSCGSLHVLFGPPIKITFADYLAIIFFSSAVFSLLSCCCSHCLSCSLWWLLCGAAPGGQSCCVLAVWVYRWTASSLGGLGWTVWCHRHIWAPFDPRLPGVQAQGIGKQSKDLHNMCKHSQNNDSSRRDELSQRVPSSIQLLSPAWLNSSHSYGMNMSGQE